MKKFLLLFAFLNVFTLLSSQAQKVAANEKISYQAIARDAEGQLMANQDLEIKVSFTSKDGASEIWYSELHTVQTNERGLFQLEIGGSPVKEGNIVDVPWGGKSVFLGLELKQNNGMYRLLSRSQMLAVPYAFHAGKTRKVLDEEQMELRNQSIYWNTTGNNESRPDHHFIGTKDAEDLYFKTANTKRAIFTKNGQLQIFAGSNVNGSQSNISSYPVTVQNSNQGIYIEIDEPRTGKNNFMSFADDTKIWGRVEGETWDEKTATDAYKIKVALFTLTGVSIIVKSVAEILVASGESATGTGAGAGVATYVAAGALIAEAAALLIESINWGVDQANSVGVAYSSGGADYAEYLLRASQERDLRPGQVVGIKNGTVSLNTKSADHLRVISSAPIVLGNMPPADEEFKYEKVAFRGQVPVYVIGDVQVGDYILPSGNNDGLAMAVSPEDMQIEDFKSIVGVAWSSAEYFPINIVNVAIGINSNDLGGKLDELDQKVKNILAYLQGKGSLDGLDKIQRSKTEDLVTATAEQGTNHNALEKALSDEEFDEFLQENKVQIHKMYGQAKNILIDQGYDLSKYPEIASYLDDPLPMLKAFRRDPQFLTEWVQIDNQLQDVLNKDD